MVLSGGSFNYLDFQPPQVTPSSSGTLAMRGQDRICVPVAHLLSVYCLAHDALLQSRLEVEGSCHVMRDALRDIHPASGWLQSALLQASSIPCQRLGSACATMGNHAHFETVSLRRHAGRSDLYAACIRDPAICRL